MLWAMFVACAGSEGTDDGGSLVGSLAVDGYDVDIEIVKAYGYDDGGEGVFDFPSNAEASCDDVVDLMNNYTVGKSEKIEPDEVLAGNTCRLFLNANVVDGEGTFSGSSGDPSIDAFWTLDCPQGDGAFEWENRDGDKDYYWSGDRYAGNPVDWTTTVEREDEGYRIDVEMNGFSGNYIDVLAELPGEGSITGSIFVTPCGGMADSPWL